MIFEYERPAVEIVSFTALEQLATNDDPDRTRAAEGGDGINLPSTMPSFTEGVEDW